MTFETRSKEQVYADILAAGNEAGFVVVPEFALYYSIEGKRCSKKTDVAWLSTRDDQAEHRVVAAFEVEGFDVPLTTIDLHSEVYSLIREFLQLKFPCCVPIYSLATHRPKYGHDLELVRSCVLQRSARAAERHNVVEVCNGEHRDWLISVSKVARELAGNWS
jgi:hypothetical protein